MGELAQLARAEIDVIWVDDGSHDETSARIRSLSAARFHVLRLPSTQGRGEAIRQGVLFALERGATTIGYTDADFAVSASECLRLLETHKRTTTDMTLGVRPLEQRSVHRRWMGRAFRASVGALALGEVADPQCPMKWFHVDPSFALVWQQAFELSWTFDVELLSRLLRGKKRSVLQIELRQWIDRPGSRHSLGSLAWSYVQTIGFVVRHFRSP